MHFYLDIQSELNEVNINKVYLFDPPQPKSSKDDSTTSGAVQLYEQFESCSSQPPKKLPYDAKRIDSMKYSFRIHFSFVLNFE